MKDFNNVYIIDQTSEGDHHMVFNTSLVKIMSIINPNSQLVYYGRPSNIESIQHLLDSKEVDKIKFKAINYAFSPKPIILKLFNYGLKEVKRMHHFFSILNKSTKDDLIVLSITTFSCFLGFKLLKVFYATPTIAVLHGDVDFVYNSDGILSKINGFAHKLIFKISAKNFKYLTLNKIEKQILVEDGYLKEQEVFEIEHPFLSIKEDIANHLPSPPLKLGHIGSMEVERKNSHYIFQLAEGVKNLIKDNRVVFKSIGLMTPGVKPYKNEYVDMIVGNQDDNSPQYLTREQYELELEQLDYILFFYPTHEYIFRASGAVVDFLAKEKPIICLRHPLFEYMFNKAGNIGFMCNNLEEVQHLLEKITSNTYDLKAIYKLQVENIKQYKQAFTISNVAQDLQTQMHASSIGKQ